MSKVIVIKSDVAYGMDLPVDVSPDVSDIIYALNQGIVYIEHIGVLKDVRNGVPVIHNWEDLNGVKLGRKAMCYNTVHVVKLFVEDKMERRIWSSNVAHWISVSKKRIATIADVSSSLRELSLLIKNGWVNKKVSILCANCGSKIYGVRSTKGTQSKFTPDNSEGVTKGEGKNCRKWYCGCTTKPAVIPEHLIKEVEESVKDELEKLRLDYSIALADVKRLEDMASTLTDKVNFYESNEGLLLLVRKVFVDKFPGSMDSDQILAFARVINYLKGDK